MTGLVRPPATGVSSLFSALARLRRAPGVHPQRVGFAGHVVVDTANALLPEGDHPVDLQLSKGAGTPGGRPDVLGIALRIQPAGDPWDFLFSTAGHGRLSRWIPVPSPDWSAVRYGSLAPYDVAGVSWWLMLTPTGEPTGHALVAAAARARVPGEPARPGGESGVTTWVPRRCTSTPYVEGA
ncbi:hypothetical protein [Kribbella lupini]|uniref:Phosphodiesterase n=1 Tax=Kribbella lupini TaxID=291602 RepID=A0ABN2AMI1_9ACTN